MQSQHHKASDHPHGKKDGLLDLMKVAGVPLTREHYLNLSYLGRVPHELTPEQEDELPPQFRKEPSVDHPHR